MSSITTDMEQALRNDEAALKEYKLALNFLRHKERVGSLTIPGAKLMISGLKEAIRIRKKLLKSLARKTRQLP